VTATVPRATCHVPRATVYCAALPRCTGHCVLCYVPRATCHHVLPVRYGTRVIATAGTMTRQARSLSARGHTCVTTTATVHPTSSTGSHTCPWPYVCNYNCHSSSVKRKSLQPCLSWNATRLPVSRVDCRSNGTCSSTGSCTCPWPYVPHNCRTGTCDQPCDAGTGTKVSKFCSGLNTCSCTQVTVYCRCVLHCHCVCVCVCCHCALSLPLCIATVNCHCALSLCIATVLWVLETK
jgi:hypothetical protein